MKKILITGSNGFLGRHLTKKLKDLKYEVYEVNSKDANYLNVDILNRKFSDINFDYIFHLAVKTAAGGYCQKHQGEQFILNQMMNTNILSFWYTHKNAKFITFGSSCGYADDVEKIEENYMIGLPETGYEVYGMIKRMLLTGLRGLYAEYGMKYVYLIPSTIYGTNYNLNDKHFIFDLIRKICDAKYLGIEPVVLWGDGEQRRELIYIDDCVDIIINSLNKNNDVINLSTGNDYSIKDYAKTICNIVNYDFDKIEFDTTQFVGAQSKRIKNTKNKDFKFTNIKDGLSKTIEYYIKNKYGIEE